MSTNPAEEVEVRGKVLVKKGAFLTSQEETSLLFVLHTMTSLLDPDVPMSIITRGNAAMSTIAQNVLLLLATKLVTKGDSALILLLEHQ